MDLVFRLVISLLKDTSWIFQLENLFTWGRGNWLQSDITRGKNILVWVESYNDGQWMTMSASWLCQLRLKPVLLSNSNTVVTFSFVILYIMTSRVSLCPGTPTIKAKWSNAGLPAMFVTNNQRNTSSVGDMSQHLNWHSLKVHVLL
jgi:hypothetical protein